MFDLENEWVILRFLGPIAFTVMSILLVMPSDRSLYHVGVGRFGICLRNVICIYLCFTFGW
jgi:hypothetical protein